MNNLVFDDGFKEITINNDTERVIRWNPSDVNFVDRFLAFQDWVEKDFKAKIDKIEIKEGNFEDYDKGAITELGDEMCKVIDQTFGKGISEKAFMGVNPISPMSNGNLLFINFVNALMPIIEQSITDFDSARKKYTDAAKLTLAE